MATSERGRTTALSQLSPPDRSGRRAFMVSTGLIALLMVGNALLCNGLSLAGALIVSPGLSTLAALTAGQAFDYRRRPDNQRT